MPICMAARPADNRLSPRQAEEVRSPRYTLGVLVPAALLTHAAATVHLFVAPDHFVEYAPYGIALLHSDAHGTPTEEPT